MAIILVYVTHSNLNDAKKIVAKLIEKKLIACANFFPITSSYFWNNKVNNSKEVVSLLKTKKENWLKVKKEIKKLHKYDTPCIIKIDVKANKEFENWINKETQS